VLAHRRNRIGVSSIEDYVAEVELRSEDYDGPVEFDELVIDHWFHLEQMDDRVWWMDVAGLHITVHIDGHGLPRISQSLESTPEEVAARLEAYRVNAPTAYELAQEQRMSTEAAQNSGDNRS
jgi:hypothetical protein